MVVASWEWHLLLLPRVPVLALTLTLSPTLFPEVACPPGTGGLLESERGLLPCSGQGSL